MITPLFSVFLYQFLVCFLSMQIFFFCCHTTSDMPLLFIHLQHISHLFGKRRIDLLQSVCTVFMYRTFTDSEFLRRLSHCCIILYNKHCDFHGSFFNIIFQKNPLQTSFYNVCKGFYFYSMCFFSPHDSWSTRPAPKEHNLNTCRNSLVNCMESVRHFASFLSSSFETAPAIFDPMYHVHVHAT